MTITLVNNWSSLCSPKTAYGNLAVLNLCVIGFMVRRKDAKPTRKVKDLPKGFVFVLLGVGVMIDLGLRK